MQQRIMIENVKPEIAGGRHFIKRIIGETIQIEANILADGHDVLNASVLYKYEKERNWHSSPLSEVGNDLWKGSFKVEKQGFYHYKIVGWLDHALTWQHNLERKVKDGQYVNVELLDGIQYLDFLEKLVSKSEKNTLNIAKTYFSDPKQYENALKMAFSKELTAIFHLYPYQKNATTYDKGLKVYVDRKKALFSSWYEFFPRSASQEIGKHGTFKDCELVLPRVAELGFDTLYFPPIHPIGIDHRKGKNNSTTALPGDVGSPWAIGGIEGGHKDIHPELGTLEDFKHLVKTAKEYGIEIALDYALQCSPNHPYVKEHPQWFKWRPDGSVQYAENPPKKYQDILPINFETEDWQNLWNELLSILMYWIEQGVHIFRVDNPHTKSFYFWEWAIAEVKKKHADVIFLAEAFTRPQIMHQLAKVGYSQGYSYYVWRTTKKELLEYMTEITFGEGREYFRPNFWANTPDINPYPLQNGNKSLFLSRYFMSATLTSNYGMYGPVYEYMIHAPVPNKEEYLNSEKYEIKHWNWNSSNLLVEVIKRVNWMRKENPALQDTYNFHNCQINNDNVFAYFKQDETKQNNILCIVNLDPNNRQGGFVQVPLQKMGLQEGESMIMHDLLTGNRYLWNREWNYVELSADFPFHLFRIERP
jgi:starch synthase (maltosyl-transferring)